MKKIALIPARSGSKRLIDKNILKINGNSLIKNSLLHAKAIQVDEIIIYTDIDSNLLESDVTSYFKVRPKYTCEDNAKANSYLKEFVEEITCDSLIVLLQPTSPFRNIELINNSIDKYIKDYQGKSKILASASLFNESLWEKIKSNQYIKCFHNEVRRQQEREPKYIEDGNFYIFSSESFKDIKYDLDNLSWDFVINSFPFGIDINTADDYILAEIISKNIHLFSSNKII